VREAADCFADPIGVRGVNLATDADDRGNVVCVNPQSRPCAVDLLWCVFVGYSRHVAAPIGCVVSETGEKELSTPLMAAVSSTWQGAYRLRLRRGPKRCLNSDRLSTLSVYLRYGAGSPLPTAHTIALLIDQYPTPRTEFTHGAR